MHHDVTWLQGRLQVLEGEKAEGQRQFESVQVEGVILRRQVGDLISQDHPFDLHT